MPVRNSSRAADAPIFWSTYGEIIAGRMPSLVSVKPKIASGSVTTMSHTAASPEPPPSAAPWMRPITIAGTVLIARNIAAPAQAQTEKITPQAQAAAKNLMESISTVGCIRLWQPAPADPTRMPPDRQPGLAGVYLLTPMSSTPTTEHDVPTYILTPSATLSFS